MSASSDPGANQRGAERDADAGEAGVDFDVDAGDLAQFAGSVGQHVNCFVVNGLVDVVLDQKPGFLGGEWAQVEYGSGKATVAQGDGGGHFGHGELLDAVLLQLPGDSDGAVAVGIGLDHAHDGDVTGLGLDLADIVGQGGAVDFQPGVGIVGRGTGR